MPQSPGVRQNEIQNHPEQAHTKAATSHTQSDHLTAHELSKEAQDRTRHAHEHTEHLVKEAEKK